MGSKAGMTPPANTRAAWDAASIAWEEKAITSKRQIPVAMPPIAYAPFSGILCAHLLHLNP